MDSPDPVGGNRAYLPLLTLAIVATLAWVAWSLYDSLVLQKSPGDYAYHAAGNYFADGDYNRALAEYRAARRQSPDHRPARRGEAETLIVLGREREAIEIYLELLAEETEPVFQANLHANLGIAYDRIGEHVAALRHYDQALALDPETGGGPGWLTRFLRNQPAKPPGIGERSRYLREQLALPVEERVLRVPALDEAQRPYKE